MNACTAKEWVSQISRARDKWAIGQSSSAPRMLLLFFVTCNSAFHVFEALYKHQSEYIYWDYITG